MQVIGYVRVSTEEQGLSGAGLQAQRATILAECERRGWFLVEVIEDIGKSGKDLKREGIRAALELLAAGQASALVVSKLDRVSRSLIDFAGIMATAQKQSWALVALDVQVDTSTPSGEAMAHMLATFAQFERRLISERTKNALAQKRAAGVRLGAPPLIGDQIGRRVRGERDAGRSLREIADLLNAEGVPTVRGGEWRASTLQRVLARTEPTKTP
jgi:DNA invertase Pin-like site-specific DNA recombinase